ncbi:MAG: methyltransferase domain-containing protein [Saprospiraceae bacterium]|nr:methyltransferase domain-containing protein [Saprospiraceae bacterium]
MNNQNPCDLCASNDTYIFFDLASVPTQDGVMSVSEEAALNAVRGNIRLQFCRKCGFIQNIGYDPDKISFDKYDFSNDNSPLFRAFVIETCDRLLNQYGLKGKTVLDIGSGKGDFLRAICSRGAKRGIGIDPGFDLDRIEKTEYDIEYIREYYSPEYASLRPDLVVSRHVINVLEDQKGLIKTIRDNLDDQNDTILYLEVPNALYTFKEKIIWNVAYEHRAWFTVDSLSYMLEICGFEVLQVNTCWYNEFIGIEARPRSGNAATKIPNRDRLLQLESILKYFTDDFQKKMNAYQIKIEAYQSQKLKIIAWGSGARAVTFFNLFDLKEMVPFIVDINKNRQNKFLPGSGQEIVAPDFISAYKPDLVIITNPTYADEIQEQIGSYLLTPEIWIL